MSKSKNIIGIYRATEKKFGFVQIEDGNEDIFIPSKFVNNAIDGDTVRVKIYKPKEKERKAEGKIEKIIQREIKEIIGIFQKSKNFGFVVPDDKKIGTDIFVPKNKCKNANTNDKVVVKITKYPEIIVLV